MTVGRPGAWCAFHVKPSVPGGSAGCSSFRAGMRRRRHRLIALPGSNCPHLMPSGSCPAVLCRAELMSKTGSCRTVWTNSEARTSEESAARSWCAGGSHPGSSAGVGKPVILWTVRAGSADSRRTAGGLSLMTVEHLGCRCGAFHVKRRPGRSGWVSVGRVGVDGRPTRARSAGSRRPHQMLRPARAEPPLVPHRRVRSERGPLVRRRLLHEGQADLSRARASPGLGQWPCEAAQAKGALGGREHAQVRRVGS